MKNPPEPAVLKAALRMQFATIRLGMNEEEYLQRSVHACARVLTLPEIEAARTVGVYWPLVDRRELDSRPLIRELMSRGCCVALPVVTGRTPPTMEYVLMESEAALRPNSWGIPEPDGPAIPAAELDAVIVPALGVGRNGHRIGHGFGYYDIFLRDVDCTSVGLVFKACLAGFVPGEPHDVALDILVTEDEVVRVGNDLQRNTD